MEELKIETDVRRRSVSNVFVRRSPESGPDNAEIDQLVAERNAAKKKRDFAAADRIRKELADRGIIIEDEKDGSVRWKRK